MWRCRCAWAAVPPRLNPAQSLGMLLCALLLHACGTVPRIGGYGADGGPSEPPMDVYTVPDAIPHIEPRSRYGNPPFYVVDSVQYRVLDSADGYVERGIASWYGTKFHGQRTSSGEPYDMYAMTAAHRSLPLPTYARVTNLINGKSVVVRINDRGPFHSRRLIDLSYTAAAKLDILRTGTGLVEVRAIDPTLPAEPVSITAAAKRAPQPLEAVTAVSMSRASEPASARSATDTAIPVEPATRSATEPGVFLQVGAFTRRRNAEHLRDRVQDSGLPEATAVHISQGQNRSATFYRVRIGPLPSREQADSLTRDLLRLGLPAAHVVAD